MDVNYKLGYKQKINNKISFNTLFLATLEEINDFTKYFKSQDELISFIEEDITNMYAPLEIINIKTNKNYKPLFEMTRLENDSLISANINDIFWDNPRTSHNIETIRKMDDITYIKYLADYPELIFNGISPKIKRKVK